MGRLPRARHKTFTPWPGRGARVAALFVMMACSLGPAQGQERGAGAPSPATGAAGLRERAMPEMDALLGDVDCTNGAGHKVADWGLAPRMFVTRRGVLVYRWLEYGTGKRGSGWTVMYARARLQDLNPQSGLEAEMTLGTCSVVELYCKSEGCVRVQTHWGEAGPDQYRNDFIIYTRDAETAQAAMARLRSSLSGQ